MKQLLQVHNLTGQQLTEMGVDTGVQSKDNQDVGIAYARLVDGDTVCPVCAQIYRTTKRLRQHMAEAHMEAPPKHKCR